MAKKKKTTVKSSVPKNTKVGDEDNQGIRPLKFILKDSYSIRGCFENKPSPQSMIPSRG